MFVHAVALSLNIPEYRFWGRYLDAAGLYKRADSVKPVGRHGNGDRYSVDPGAVIVVAAYIRYKRSPWCLKGGKVTVTVTPSRVSTDSATGKPRYATASRIQKWSYDGVHGSPSRQSTDSKENPHPTWIR